MKAIITSYKASGKWYDKFDIDLPDDPTTLIFKEEVKKFVEKRHSQLKEYNWTIEIVDDRPGYWLMALFINTFTRVGD
jgi:hypothetical protein